MTGLRMRPTQRLKSKYSDGPIASRHAGFTFTSDILARGIPIESKGDVKHRIGRSPDRGDAVVMASRDGFCAAVTTLANSGRSRCTPSPPSAPEFAALSF